MKRRTVPQHRHMTSTAATWRRSHFDHIPALTGPSDSWRKPGALLSLLTTEKRTTVPFPRRFLNSQI